MAASLSDIPEKNLFFLALLKKDLDGWVHHLFRFRGCWWQTSGYCQKPLFLRQWDAALAVWMLQDVLHEDSWNLVHQERYWKILQLNYWEASFLLNFQSPLATSLTLPVKCNFCKSSSPL